MVLVNIISKLRLVCSGCKKKGRIERQQYTAKIKFAGLLSVLGPRSLGASSSSTGSSTIGVASLLRSRVAVLGREWLVIEVVGESESIPRRGWHTSQRSHGP